MSKDQPTYDNFAQWAFDSFVAAGIDPSDVEIRPYQVQAWQALHNSRANGSQRALGHLATGLGKTTVAVMDVKNFVQHRNENGERARVLWISHKHDLNAQAAERFSLLTPELSLGTFRSNAHELADVSFATVQTLWSHINPNNGKSKSKAPIDPDLFDYIVFDEGHHVQARTFKPVVEHFNCSFLHGLTATPERGDKKDIRDIFGDALYQMGLDEGIAQGWLAHVDYRVEIDNVTEQRIAEGDFDDTTLAGIRELFRPAYRMEDARGSILEKITAAREGLDTDKRKTIVFCSSKEEADHWAEVLGGVIYDSRIPLKKRPEVLAGFKSGDFDVLVTIDMANEGLDIPDANMLVFLRSTESKTIFEQQLGRGLRKAKGKDHVIALDFVANFERLMYIQELADALDLEIKGTGGRGDRVAGERDSSFTPFEVKTQVVFNTKLRHIFDLYRSRLDIAFAPDGVNSINGWANELGIWNETLSDRLVAAGVEPVGVFKFGTRSAEGYSREQIESLGIVNVSVAPDGVKSISGWANESGVTRKTLRDRLVAAGVEPVGVFRFGVTSAEGFSRDQIESLGIVNVSVAPDGVKSVSGWAKELNVGIRTLRDRLVAAGVEPVGVFRFGVTSAEGFSRDQIESLGIVNVSVAPDGVNSINGWAKELDVTDKTLRDRLVAAGVEPVGVYRFGVWSLEGYSRDQIESLGIVNVTVAPENVNSISGWAKELGIGTRTLKTGLVAAGVEPVGVYKFHKTPAEGYSRDQIESLDYVQTYELPIDKWAKKEDIEVKILQDLVEGAGVRIKNGATLAQRDQVRDAYIGL
jgi:superfamily II DNA or RNA helicase